MQQDHKNMILAIALSIIVLVSWAYFIEAPRNKARLETLAQQQERAEDGDGVRPASAPSAVAIPAAAPTVLDRKEILEATQASRIRISNDEVHGSISTKGLRFDDLTLANYHETIEKGSPEVALLAPSGSNQVYFAEFGWLSNSTKVPGNDTVWNVQQGAKGLSPNAPLVFYWDNGGGLTFTRTVALDENYLFTITDKVVNSSAGDVVLTPYGLINRERVKGEEFIISHEGALSVFNGILYEETYNDLVDKGSQSFKQVSGWLGMADKYWITAMVPQQDRVIDANFSYSLRNEQRRFQVDFVGQPVALPSGQSYQTEYHLLAGAKKIDLLDRYEQEKNIPMFDHAVDFGRLYFLTKPIFLALEFFNKILGNFGLAILLFTVCIKILLFPLANKGYLSMAKLKDMAPLMKELRERYKDDKVRLQKETMELYKREKINPVSGCLPILIQLPIFFALYKVLFINIEMRHAPFYGWIHDLTAPDPTAFLNLFGLLPFSVPPLLSIGAWPLIMCITMVIQQRLNPPPPDPAQAMVIKLLPFIFLFLFAHFPAGLIIYWAWSNFLSIIQQWLITRTLPKRRAAKQKE